MKIYKLKDAAKQARKSKISDEDMQQISGKREQLALLLETSGCGNRCRDTQRRGLISRTSSLEVPVHRSGAVFVGDLRERIGTERCVRLFSIATGAVLLVIASSTSLVAVWYSSDSRSSPSVLRISSSTFLSSVMS